MKIKTPEQVKKEFEAKGKSFAEWAKENGYDRFYVYRVLNGSIKAKRGIGHEIAVKLGLK
ncbi:DNA-binding protein [Phocoenobacter skyensis]|uniref:DNA-binding protein n=1 Tax=Phocoenobacter skyensis TaxID=97481 RepID=A0AAJ6N9D1_9PAST|nr:DNA-binding protein [Pasteurella skyensis]MDP8080224.1 DNA-binding protein [Pasteurella skyensis]MDP8086237.1 DNA-binding protein [Pasteurella skyensis]MDP8162828.1 DNA-binding protein [Pasteurella skyensis]MDP8172585.1 DNA-binding protein [Pasteurella skyensis]MDP8179085.1 DNA-binding protein [Pasteurella skyensis]